MIKAPAPVALFVYNRPWHTSQTIQSLAANTLAAKTDLFVFSDAARNLEAEKAVQEVRHLLKSISGFKNIVVVEREINFGLADSIIDGATRLCNDYGRVIVVEDDLETSQYFLEYMNDALSLYEDDERVSSISGYMYPIDWKVSDETIFLPFPMSWGWATWSRAWKDFDSDGKKLMDTLQARGLWTAFDQTGPGTFRRMLKNQIAGKNNSWLIRWYASLFLNEKLSLAPVRSLVANTGIDGSGVHCTEWKYDPFKVELSAAPVKVLPIDIEVRPVNIREIRHFFLKVRIYRYLNAFHRVIQRIIAR